MVQYVERLWDECVVVVKALQIASCRCLQPVTILMAIKL